MRTLEFDVKDQTLSKSDNCDFSGIIQGSKGYLKCEFHFDSSWSSYRKVVHFSAKDSNEFYELPEGITAIIIPDTVTAYPFFKISLHGISGNEQFETNKVLIRQERSL